ncbi:MAG: alpha/beta fold hydrolase, partial [Propionibacteriaceae bacterium]|nr:alpha/beta fold hydrolase [Propionibacteriaceae bacterium]
MRLHTETVGPTPPRLAFLHGLFGRGRNWAGIARSLATAPDWPGTAPPPGFGQRPLGSLLVDLPNHGDSGWTPRFSYLETADIVAAELPEHAGKTLLVGHSMGGKVAMLVAQRHPQLLAGLVVIDIAPGLSGGVRNFDPVVEAVMEVDLKTVSTRADVDERLRERVPDPAVRALLLQNLKATPNWHWQPNLDLLAQSLPAIEAWPAFAERPWNGPVLWIKGAESPYVKPEHLPTMRRLF